MNIIKLVSDCTIIYTYIVLITEQNGDASPENRQLTNPPPPQKKSLLTSAYITSDILLQCPHSVFDIWRCFTQAAHTIARDFITEIVLNSNWMDIFFGTWYVWDWIYLLFYTNNNIIIFVKHFCHVYRTCFSCKVHKFQDCLFILSQLPDLTWRLPPPSAT
jgi:hypothetical protein